MVRPSIPKGPSARAGRTVVEATIRALKPAFGRAVDDFTAAFEPLVATEPSSLPAAPRAEPVPSARPADSEPVPSARPADAAPVPSSTSAPSEPVSARDRGPAAMPSCCMFWAAVNTAGWPVRPPEWRQWTVDQSREDGETTSTS